MPDPISVTVDPDGRRVGLTAERWRHIKTRHPDLTRRLRDVMEAVREPDRRLTGRTSNEEWYLTRQDRPVGWLQVVVHYEGGEGWIATAFTRPLARGR